MADSPLWPPSVPAVSDETWSLPRVVLDAKHLEAQRIVSFAMTDPSHVAFNLLRTKIQKIMRDNKWKSLAVLSPTPGCGKTTVSVNLAFSLARQTNCRTALIDLDLRKSAMAKVLGIKAEASISQFLEGQADLRKCFVRIADNLVVAINNQSVRLSSELLQDQKAEELLTFVAESLRPEITLFDLPPMLSSDDAIGFLPRVDCSLLVIAAGKTTAIEVDECERQATAAGNFIGVVLNKCQGSASEYYQYESY